MLIDSHCHVNFNAYSEDAEETIQRSLAKDIWLVNIGSQYSTSERTIKIAEDYDVEVYAVVGLHPIHLTQDITESSTFNGKKYDFTTRKEIFDYEKYKKLALSSQKVVGLGEVGLDYFYFDKLEMDAKEIKDIQKETLRSFIKLGQELDLPLVFHCRGEVNNLHQAYDDLYEIIKDNNIRGVVHCFGGTLEQAQKFVDAGFYIGFTGIITFKKTEELQEIVRQLPLDKILVETDAPFLSPEPNRGKRNEPAYVEFVAKKVAEIKQVSFETVVEQTFANTRELFKI